MDIGGAQQIEIEGAVDLERGSVLECRVLAHLTIEFDARKADYKRVFEGLNVNLVEDNGEYIFGTLVAALRSVYIWN